ncbi:MAG TPA: hypothetical protein VGD64_16980 [Acidisarcina sp.]
MTKGPTPGSGKYPWLRVFLLTCAAVLIHGYHLGTDDGEIYLPAVNKFVNPELYPFGSQFFTTHERLTLFSKVVGITSYLTHLPVSAAVFAWHLIGIFLLLLASWRLLGTCFESARARWTGVSLLAAVLAVPVANTALVIMDPYLTARSLSTPSTVFALAFLLSRKYKRAAAWWFLTALIHPQMSAYLLVFAAILWGIQQSKSAVMGQPTTAFAIIPAFIPRGFALEPAPEPYREALMMRSYFFLQNWAWYEWCGAVLPLAILWALSSVKLRGTLPLFRQVCRALVVFGGLSIAAALIVSLPDRMQMLARLQPMRSLHLVYVIFFLFLGGLTGEYCFRQKEWLRAAVLFVPIAVGMWFVGRETYPSSPHIEWPGLRWHSPYISAFLWIRDNTPKGAVFALDPKYMRAPGVDEHGFRALAERSVLADYYKDSGAVAMFPQLAGEWKREVTAQDGWEHFGPGDFERLARQYPVSWILVEGSGPAGFDCPYHGQGLAVCRIPSSAGQRPASDHL